MTREIKFRGRMKMTKQWMYGDLAHVQGQPCIQVDVSTDEKKTVRMNVDPDSVCQFTGLYDKNGKEIYEGDIVRFNQKFLIDNTFHVGYENSHRGGFSLCTKDGYYCMFGDAWLEPFYCEVIGNIYDDNELLKGG